MATRIAPEEINRRKEALELFDSLRETAEYLGMKLDTLWKYTKDHPELVPEKHRMKSKGARSEKVKNKQAESDKYMPSSAEEFAEGFFLMVKQLKVKVSTMEEQLADKNKLLREQELEIDKLKREAKELEVKLGRSKHDFKESILRTIGE